MIQEVEKPPKMALCRACRGMGKVPTQEAEPSFKVSPQCEGSGRVTVSAKMIFDIRPYKPNQ